MASQVLIIDDEEIILKSLKAIFRNNGIEADTEANPLRAIGLFDNGNYSIALVDVLMPQMRGAEVIRAIKQKNPLCNVVVMTAFSSMSHVVDCMEAGATDYITKPFTDIHLLVDVVRQCQGRVERWRTSFGLDLKNVVASHRSQPQADKD